MILDFRMEKRMNDLISRKYLYDKMLEKEELARQRVLDTPTHSPAYLRYVAQFNERTALKHESADAPDVTDTNVGCKWIPCSERLPKSEDKYGWVECIVTVMRSHWPTSSYDSCDSPYDEYFVTGAMYDTSQKIWHLGEHTQLNALIDIEDSPLNGDYVIAWQPLPHAFKGE